MKVNSKDCEKLDKIEVVTNVQESQKRVCETFHICIRMATEKKVM